jgi:hypothetical protein
VLCIIMFAESSMNAAQAPRFELYLTKKHFEGRPVFTWPKDQWESIAGQGEKLAVMDVTATPMRGVASVAPILACVAEQYASPDAKISIYRHDAADGSTPVNKDSYKVLTGKTLKNMPNLSELALSCGTCADANMNQFLEENVFLVKEDRRDDHWIGKLPASVQVLIDQK